MAHCGVCDKEVVPYQDIAESGRILDLCPKCNGALGVSGQTQPGSIEAAKQNASQPKGPEPEKSARVLAMPERRLEVVHGGQADPIELARQQLADIEKELERLGELQRKRKRLAAMVAAADALDDEEPATSAHEG